MERASLNLKKGGGTFSHLPVVGKPIRPPQQQSQTKQSVVQTDKEMLSLLVSEMSEESKKQEAKKFNT